MKIKKTYSYALWSAIYLTLLSVTIAAISYFLVSKHFGTGPVLICILVLFIISFFIIQYRAEHFIYRRLKRIYEDVSILDVNDLRKDSVTTDIDKLSKRMQTYVEGKVWK
jgi:two-component system phosphate regulon sensor histidine kinase PhoR